MSTSNTARQEVEVVRIMDALDRVVRDAETPEVLRAGAVRALQELAAAMADAQTMRGLREDAA